MKRKEKNDNIVMTNNEIKGSVKMLLRAFSVPLKDYKEYKELTLEEKNEIKQKVLLNGLNRTYDKISLRYFLLTQTQCTGEQFKLTENDSLNSVSDDFIELLVDYTMVEIKVASNLNQAHRARTNRLKKRIQEYVMSGDAVFLTLTFTNAVLESTSKQTRRRYVSRYLKSQTQHYVANIDYGGKNGREHYHAITLGKVDPKAWSYGALNARFIRAHQDDITRVSKYVSKLTNHAIKETTKSSRILYSK